jgi:3,4-dihydroxy 2-butanone 4-phosphate synthase/GTP cyclohydrolase II
MIGPQQQAARDREAEGKPAGEGGCNLRLLTNNPAKRVGLEGYGLRDVERVPLEIAPNDENRRYLITKRDKLGHLLTSLPD